MARLASLPCIIMHISTGAALMSQLALHMYFWLGVMTLSRDRAPRGVCLGAVFIDMQPELARPIGLLLPCYELAPCESTGSPVHA